jgi:hypothetical protein
MKTFKEEIKDCAENIKKIKRKYGYHYCRMDSYLIRLKYIAYKHYKHKLKEFNFNFYKISGIEKYPNKLSLSDIKRINMYLDSWKED